MAAHTQPRRRRLARILWPLALVVWLLPSHFVSPYGDTTGGALVAVGLLPPLPGVVLAGFAVGGRRGVATTVGLTLLVAWWAWWFGWGIDSNISPLSFDLAANGLISAAEYHRGLGYDLWPLLVAAAVVVAAWTRVRGRDVWASLGLLALMLVVLAFPVSGTWGDGCNDGDGATPLITWPVATKLMDLGVGVIPDHSMTMVGCGSTEGLTWKPFWQGGDHLPAKPGNRLGSAFRWGIWIPTDILRTPEPLPGRHLDVAVGRDDRLNELFAVVRVDRRLPRVPLDEGLRDVRIGGFRHDDTGRQDDTRGKGWCYEFVWAPDPGPRVRLPSARGGRRVRVVYSDHGRLLGAGVSRIAALHTSADFVRLRHRLGCRLRQ